MKFTSIVFIFILFVNNGFCQSIFSRDSLTTLADSLHNDGNYEKSLLYRKKALSKTYKTDDYKLYIQAKYYHTNSARLEFKSYNYHNPNVSITKKARELYLDSALQYAIKARDIYLQAKVPDKKFQYNIQNRIYHQTAYLGNWKHALEQAQLGLKIVKDTLSSNDKTFVDLIYDIGYIYSKLGDYSKAVENYQTSLNLYKNIIGDTHTDIAQAYNNIAVEYRNLGLHKKELESLLKAKAIWEGLNQNDDKQFLYRCYRNLFYWYSYYGDYDKAEEYILKKQKLRATKFASQINGFLRNKEEIYEDKLKEWHDLMLHYARKKDTLKSTFYAQQILKTINTTKKLLPFETTIVTATMKFYANLIASRDKVEALSLIDKAIHLQQSYKSIQYTKEIPFLLAKVELLLDSKRDADAIVLLKQISTLDENKEIQDSFKIAILNGRAYQALKKYSQAQHYFDKAYTLLKNDNDSLEHTNEVSIKPLVSFEVIEGFLRMGDLYMELNEEKNNKVFHEKAIHRYLLAATIYNQLYLGEHYNDELYKSYNAINERLLQASLKDPSNQTILINVLNTIENNGSKLIWSKFVFNNQRQQLDVPKHFLHKEESIKAQLNFYQKQLLSTNKELDLDKIAIWKEKVFEFKNELNSIQDSIKLYSKAYYQFTINHFDIYKLQKNLHENEVILRYVQTAETLYVFSITKGTIKLQLIGNKTFISDELTIGLNKLKTRNQSYQKNVRTLKELLLPNSSYASYKKITIIPDGPLQYFPFEVLMMSEGMPSVSYAPSLLLYTDQQSIFPDLNQISLGAFSASNPDAMLASVSKEVNNITAIIKGKQFLKASKDQFLANANKFTILHLAMHSQIDDVHPEFSSLDFYGEKDNKLFISELYNETFKANMAVLSACDTGNGLYKDGEGVISLSRAFNYAGIPSTVMSLWKVDDHATAQIMEYFYIHLKKGEPKDEALKNAKLDYLKFTEDELLKHPYYWSGFVISGNTHPLFDTPNSWWWSLFILPLVPLIAYRKKLFQRFQK